MTYSFVLLKPDCVERSLVGLVIGHLEVHGLTVAASKVELLSQKQLDVLYQIHINEPYYKRLCMYMTSGRVMPLVLTGKSPDYVRTVVGATDPSKALEGTIRQKYGLGIPQNTIHASDSPDSAYREMSIFFRCYDIPHPGPQPSGISIYQL